MPERTAITLDARSFHVEFTASLGPLQVHGAFDEVRGTLELDESGIEQASIEVEVSAESLRTGLGMRDHHLRGPSFLDVTRHPVITFRSLRVSRDNGELLIAGHLTLRGKGRDVVTRCAISNLERAGSEASVAFSADLIIPVREHGIGIPIGLDVVNPIFLVVGRTVHVHTRLTVPARRVLPALLPALGR